MWRISTKTNIILSLISASNQITWKSGLSKIVMTINEYQHKTFEQSRILNTAEHLKWSFLQNY